MKKKRAFRLLLECRQTILKQNKLSDSAKNKIEFQYLNRFKKNTETFRCEKSA